MMPYVLKGNFTKSLRTDSESETVKLFNRLMMRGKIRDAINCLSENGRTAILHPDSVVSTMTGQTVFETLQVKHSEPNQSD